MATMVEVGVGIIESERIRRASARFGDCFLDRVYSTAERGIGRGRVVEWVA